MNYGASIKTGKIARKRGEQPEDRRAESDLVGWIGDWLAVRRLRRHPEMMAWLRMENWIALEADKAAGYEELKFPATEQLDVIHPIAGFGNMHSAVCAWNERAGARVERESWISRLCWTHSMPSILPENFSSRVS